MDDIPLAVASIMSKCTINKLICVLATTRIAVRSCLLALLLALGPVLLGSGVMLVSTQHVEAAVVSTIDVRGNKRMEAQTIKSFLTIKPGTSFDGGDIDDSVKALYGTGLFGDVSIYQSGSILIVEVSENATINEIFI